MPRQRKKIDPEQVRQLAMISCTMEEIGFVLGCSVDTLERRFADVIKEGRAFRRMSLKREQYKAAMAGNITMLIWLGKNDLGQSDKIDQNIQTHLSLDRNDERFKIALEEVKKLAKEKVVWEPVKIESPKEDSQAPIGMEDVPCQMDGLNGNDTSLKS